MRSKRIGKVSELTVVTPIRRGWVPDERRSYRRRLIEVLDGLQRRIDAGVHAAPELIGTIHFARWFIVENSPFSAPDAAHKGAIDPHPGWLVFTSNFDGDLMLYLRDFAQRIPQQIDDVWSNCEGYPEGGCRDFDRFAWYVRSHQIRTLAFVAAYPDKTVDDIRLASLVRR